MLIKKILTLFISILFIQVVNGQSILINEIKKTAAVVYLSDGTVTTAITVERKWNGGYCASTIRNNGKREVRLKEIVLMQANRLFSPSTTFYAEGFQMLSQYKGTIANPIKVGSFDDNAHYKLPQPPGYKAVYNMLLLEKDGSNILMGFNSSFRFVGKFYLSADTVKVVMDMENTLMRPGESIRLEEFSLLRNKSINELTNTFAGRINYFHPRLKSKNIPAGWCSWYCFGPDVTAKNISDNLAYIKKKYTPAKIHSVG